MQHRVSAHCAAQHTQRVQKYTSATAMEKTTTRYMEVKPKCELKTICVAGGFKDEALFVLGFLLFVGKYKIE